MTNNKFNKIIELAIDKQKQNEFNDEIAKKTNYYQQKFKFETNPRKGHEFWNVEADAFKHAYGAADMALNMGQIGSFLGGVYHEMQTPNNPPKEWNMDSWNNNQGRIIAKEIQKEYGKDFYKLPKQKQEDIIAVKVMIKMQNGELITHPEDSRKYNGWKEEKAQPILKKGTDLIEKYKTGYAASIEDINHIFTPQEIGAMSSNEFAQNESTIMQQLKDGLIQNKIQNHNYAGYINPITGNGQIFSREDISAMSGEDYSKFEKAIDAQLNTIGIPTNNELQNASINGGGTVYVHPYTRADGTNVKGYYRSR